MTLPQQPPARPAPDAQRPTPDAQRPTPPDEQRPTTPAGEPLADFGDRVLAWIVDAAILATAGLIVTVPAVVAMVTVVASRDADEHFVPAVLLPVVGIQTGVVAVSLIIRYVYEVEMAFRTGQTVGKRLMKLRVTTPDGSPLSRRVMAKRWLLGHVGGILVPGLFWIDGLWQLWDQPYRQCLHDKFAETVVVKGVLTKGVA